MLAAEALETDGIIKTVPGSLMLPGSNSWSKTSVATTVGTKTFDIGWISIKFLGSRGRALVEDLDILFKLSPDIPYHLGGKQIIGSDLSGVWQKDNKSRKT